MCVSPTRLPQRLLFLGSCVFASAVGKQARSLAARIHDVVGETFEVVVAEPPFDVNADLEERGFWLRPVARKEEDLAKWLRKQVLIGLVSWIE